MNATAVPQQPRIPDDIGVIEVHHPRTRWGRGGQLIGWVLWERHGSTINRRMVYARQEDRTR